MPEGLTLPGALIQAARSLLALSQLDLSSRAGVSKKIVNDYENGFITPKQAIVDRLRECLEGEGARFIGTRSRIGVITVAAKPVVEGRSRSPRISGTTPLPSGASTGRPRGRPRVSR